MTTDLDIQVGVSEVLLGVQRADTSSVVPRTTLTATATGGVATSITATDPTIFGLGSSVSFLDTLGEERLYVANSWTGSNPVPVDFTLAGYSTLQHTHPAGTTVYTNLFDTTPWDIASGLVRGNPVLFVRVMQAATRQLAMPSGNYTTYQADIQYHRVLTAPNEENGERINPNLWADRQERLARGDVALITAGLLADQTLLGIALAQQGFDVGHTRYAEQMGTLNANGDKVTARWRSETISGDTTHLYACLTAVYVALN